MILDVERTSDLAADCSTNDEGPSALTAFSTMSAPFPFLFEDVLLRFCTTEVLVEG